MSPPTMIGSDTRVTSWQFLKQKFGYTDDQIRPYNFSTAPFLADKKAIQQGYVTSEVFSMEEQGVKPVVMLLADSGYTGYAAIIDPVRAGYALSAYVYLDIAQRSWKSVRAQLLTMPEVDHIAFVSGEHDILLRVRARDAVSLRDVVVARLQDIQEVNSTQTMLIFEEATPVRDPRDLTR